MKTTKKRTAAPALAAIDIERLNALRHRPPAHDDDNLPLTAAQLGQAVRHRGRPRGSRKVRLTVRIDTDVVAWLKSTGSGYQTRLNGILRRAKARTAARH